MRASGELKSSSERKVTIARSEKHYRAMCVMLSRSIVGIVDSSVNATSISMFNAAQIKWLRNILESWQKSFIYHCWTGSMGVLHRRVTDRRKTREHASIELSEAD